MVWCWALLARNYLSSDVTHLLRAHQAQRLLVTRYHRLDNYLVTTIVGSVTVCMGLTQFSALYMCMSFLMSGAASY